MWSVRPASLLPARDETSDRSSSQTVLGSVRVGETNKHRYVLATQSQELRQKLRTIPAVPIVHVNRSVMILEPPSDATLRAKALVRTPPNSHPSQVTRHRGVAYRKKRRHCILLHLKLQSYRPLPLQNPQRKRRKVRRLPIPSVSRRRNQNPTPPRGSTKRVVIRRYWEISVSGTRRMSIAQLPPYGQKAT